MSFYKPAHLNNHEPTTDDFSQMIEAKVNELRELVSTDLMTPIEQLYERMQDKLVEHESSKLVNPTQQQIDEVRKKVVVNLPSFKSLKSGMYVYYCIKYKGIHETHENMN